MASTCGQCGTTLDIQRSRRTPKYCSGRCRTAACRARQAAGQLPAELRERDRWVLWNPRKVPMQVNGTPASSTHPATWTSYGAVRGHARIGYVLGEGIGCLDLDHCLIDGRPTPAALRVLDRMPPTYIEISPSGDGLHIWGLLPEGPGSRRVVDGLSVETYSVGRYITVTGNAFPGSVPRLGVLPT